MFIATLNRIFETSSEAILILDTKWTIVGSNPACARLLGIDKSVLLKRNLFDLLSTSLIKDQERLSDFVKGKNGNTLSINVLKGRHGNKDTFSVRLELHLVTEGEDREIIAFIGNINNPGYITTRAMPASKTFDRFNIFLEEASLFTYLEGMSKERELLPYKKRDLVFKEGHKADKLFFIETGTIKTFKLLESGKEFVTGIWGAGDFIGQLSLLSPDGNYTENATVMENAIMGGIPKEDFIKLLYSNPTVSQKFIDMISNNLVDIQDQLVNMAFSSVRQRAARALLYLYKKGVIEDGTHEGIGIPREDFAGIIGTAKETAVRILTDFKNEGLIAMDTGRRIILLEPETLKNEAGFDRSLPIGPNGHDK